MSHTEYWTTLTANGRQKVLAAIAQQGKIEISHFAVGDGTIGESHTDLTSLKYRNEISSLHVVSGESALVEMFAVVPADVGGFYVREGAFYTSDGEAFAIIKYPETYKPDASDNAAAELGIRAIVDVEQAQVVTEKIDPSMVYASREWVKRTLSNDLALLQDEIEKNATNLTALDSKLNNKGIATKWQDLTGSVSHAFETEYNGEKYIVKNPIDDVTIAPPPFAGRSYIEQNGTNSYIKLKSPIVLQADDVVKFKFRAPTSASPQYLISGDLLIQLQGVGRYSFNTSKSTLKVDNVSVTTGTTYPLDGLIHSVEMTVTSATSISNISSVNGTSQFYKGRIYDLEVIRGGQRIHYYPLRTDAIDYIAGNLVEDEEFTYSGNWNPTALVAVKNNSASFANGDQSTFVIQSNPNIKEIGTYRFVYDYDIASGGIKLSTPNLGNFDDYQNGRGTRDYIVPIDTVVDGRVGFLSNASTTGTIKNIKVIKLNELSPSASFASSSGFNQSSTGVTFGAGYVAFDGASTAKQVVFNGAYRFSVKAGQSFRFALKVNGATQGTLRAQSLGASDANVEILPSGDGVKNVIVTAIRDHLFTPFLLTVDGWNGNVDYWSITEITDGEIIGEPEIAYENHWAKQLDSNDIGTKSDIDVGTSTQLVPSTKAVKEALDASRSETNQAIESAIESNVKAHGFGTKWQDLTGSIGHAFETEYNGEKYVVKNPIDDVTIASPDVAGRSYFEFDGVKHFVKGLALKLEKDDVIKFVVNPSKKSDLTIIDGVAGGSKRAAVFIQSDQNIAPINATNIKVDGELATHFPDDGLAHTIEVTTTTSCILDTVGADINYNFKFKGQIYDLEVIRNGQRIHYYPLRTDAIDYLAGNLVKDEEFTYTGNWKFSNTSASVSNNTLNFNAAASGTTAEILTAKNELGTYRYIYDYNVTSGSIRGYTRGGDTWDSLKSESGTVDSIVVINTVGTGDEGFISSSNTTATIKNFRVIKLNELSPSASFGSTSGFALSGGVTITGGKAVFGSGAGTKAVRFENTKLIAGKKYRVVVSAQGGTTGSFAASFAGSQDLTLRTANGVYDQVITMNSTPTNANIYTQNGWDGNIEYFSVTEVTDGEVIGEPEIAYENHWAKQLDSNDIGAKSDIDVGTSTQLVPSAKAVKDFLAQFGLGSKSANAVLISSGDLNNYRGQFFGYVSAAVSGSVANVPVPNNGYFISLPSSASNYNMQLYFVSFDTQPMRVYFRRQVNGTWLSWQRFYSTEDKPTASDVGAIPSATINGFVIVDMNTLYQKNETVFIASASTNTPKANKAYICSVKSVKSSGAYRVWQSATDYTTGEVFTRAFANNVWTAWSKVYSTNHKPTANEIHTTLGGLASSPFTFQGRDLLIYGKRALVGYDPTRENKLIINYGADWPQVDVAGNWQFGQDVTVVGDLKFIGTDSYIWTPNRENGFFGVYDSYKNAVALKYTYDGGFEFKRKLVLGSSGQTVLDAGGGLSVKVTTPTGWVDIGSQNPDFCHFYTSNPAYFFDRKISVRGEIYAGTNYDKRVYHEGNKPTASDVGAFKEHKRGITVSNSEYTTIAKVTGERFSSIITMTLFGTADSTVVSFKADLLVHHFKQVYVYSQNGGYSAISLKILSDSNEKYCIQAMVIGSKSAPLICTIQAFANEEIEFNPADISGFTNEHIHNSRKYGYAITSKYDSTGISINGNEVADASNIHLLLQSSVSKPTSGSLSLGENHLTTNNTIKLPATTSLEVDSVVKVTKRFAVTPQIEVDNPTTDKIAFFKDRVVQFDTSITFDVGAILTFILNDNKEWELQ